MAPGGTLSSPGQHCQALFGGAPRHRVLPRHWGCAGRVGTASARGQGAEPHRPPGVCPGVGWVCVCVHPAAHACKLLRGGRGKAPSWAPLQSTMAQDCGAWSGPCAVLLCLCHRCRGGCVCPQCHPDPGWAALAAAAAGHLWHTHMHVHVPGQGTKATVCRGAPLCPAALREGARAAHAAGACPRDSSCFMAGP